MNSENIDQTSAPPAIDTDDENDTVNCSTHGSSQMAFVCRHLAENPVQRWHCRCPEEANPWPDAWCDECNVAFEREGEWNENNEGVADIKLLCSGCYDDLHAQSVDWPDKNAQELWGNHADACFRLLQEKQNGLNERFQLDRYPRWDYDQPTAQLVFSGADIPDLIFDIEFAGTLSTAGNTWKWAWANFSLLPAVRSRIAAVREHGEAHDYPYLTVPLWTADEEDGWYMAGIAAEILGGHGVYRAPTGNGYVFMVMMGVRHAH
ncbi:DUF6882 domain-containing protein [Chitinimonas koreensis]|uniref:DUF6882 domain-containing protein n=1 Tax=Chitinimonas koreensis TaxID=356302 RepID=UPI0003FC717D|nr:DUF6882 domain-containing protein [Chitinimonas koreensis]